MKFPPLLISTGEASGDLHAGRLAAALRERGATDLFGLGGEQMRAAGVDLIAESHEVSVLGITEILHRLPELRRVFRRLLDAVDARKPPLAILVDFPGFHLRLARHLRRRGVRNVYFIAPQFWAWRPWRVRVVRRRFERVLCIFPFETEFYRENGVNAEFIGHPLVGRVKPSFSSAEFRSRLRLDIGRPVVALLPGSRPGEIAHNFPPLLEACRELAATHNPQFLLAAAPGVTDEVLAPAVRAGLGIEVTSGATYDVLSAADVAIVSSGTATVEAALCGAPTVVVYRVSPMTAAIARPLIRAPYFAMVNLIAGRPVVPELIQDDFTGPRLARELGRLLDSPTDRENMKRELSAVESRLHGPRGDAISRTADVVCEMLSGKATPQPDSPSKMGVN
ncbi:MAG TPA: lipid-A-disaccharide synthase [Candidatus Acidoferrales bacterium]|nr:lipid-A-disaccharide synthase [Candidatus Acidoferrales bacterium]